MPATGALINADIVDIQCLGILQQLVAAYLCELTEGMTQHPAVIIYEHWPALIAEQCLKLLLIILSGVRLEQVGPLLVMHHIHLVEQLYDAQVSLFCFSYHNRMQS